MLLAEFLRKAESALGSLYPEPEARNILTMLCSDVLGIRSYTHLIEPQYQIDPVRLPLLEASLERLRSGEPIQYVLGKAEFCGRTFRVGPPVLIPRPETEILCEKAISLLRRIDSPSVLDLCTGSGNIAWTLALSLRHARTVAVDLSEAALEIASSQPFEEALASGEHVRPAFVRYDVLQDPPALWGPFDAVLSNPPYVLESEKAAMRPNVLEYEPASALFVPDEDPLLFYRAVASWALRLLAPGGWLMVEINESTALTVKDLFASLGFCNVLIIKDFYEKDRFVSCQKYTPVGVGPSA